MNIQTCTTDATPERTALIERIVDAARKPCPPIITVRHVLCSDGQYRSIFGIPSHITTTSEYRTMGYVYQHHNGTSFGQRGQSPAELEERWAEREADNAADFRSHLVNASDERLSEQAAYWLK